MAARLIGVETEYAFAALDQNGNRSTRGRLLGELMKLAREQLVHLPVLSTLLYEVLLYLYNLLLYIVVVYISIVVLYI